LDVTVHQLLFLPEIHDNNTIFKADSLVFYGKDGAAWELYSGLLKQDRVDPIQRQYIKAQMLHLSEDSVVVNEIYKDITVGLETAKHYATFVQQSFYELNTGKTLRHIDEVRQKLNDEKSPYYKGKSAYLLARYLYERKNDLDSAWHFLMVARETFEKTKVITPIYQECLELITSFCTYKRKNLLAIRYANALFALDKYLPAADSADEARAYANRAFMMFREGDFEGTIEDIEAGLKRIIPEQNPEIYQNLMKSYLAVYMVQGKEAGWQKIVEVIHENIQCTGKDYIEMNRWKGQLYAYAGRYEQAIPYLKIALQLEKDKGLIHSARYSALCFLLSLSYENLFNFSQALKYVAQNESKEAYDINEMLDHVSSSEGYSFVSGLRCANIYFSEYNYSQNISSLQKAKRFLDVLDRVMFSQFNVAEENAILQFYLESGQDYFHLGMDVHYALWKQTGVNVHLASFVNYSEKSKNSLMYRDIQMAHKQTAVSEDIIQREFNLRAAIKEEKRKGLRSNSIFDRLIDEYTSLEKEIEQKHRPFITEGLVKDDIKMDELMRSIPDDSTCILVIDETAAHRYYTLISNHGITIEKEVSDQIKTQQLDTLINILKQPKEQNRQYISKIAKAIIPDNISICLTKRIFYVPDGIYHRFPLEAVLGGNHYLIIHLPTIRLFDKFLQKKKSEEKGAVFFAFSDKETIRSTTRTHLAELPGTYKEVMALSAQYPEAKIYTGKNATKSNFIQAYQHPNVRYIHLALHGLANSAEKDDVKLYFRTTDGGLDSLYGYELMKYKSRCKKVVLSACQSGIGAYIHGEGNYSLPRYFMINGATEVIFNYWDVED
jgi:CHAT domain-containing protein/tetratricopeptide (TPR) repeat protein